MGARSEDEDTQYGVEAERGDILPPEAAVPHRAKAEDGLFRKGECKMRVFGE